MQDRPMVLAGEFPSRHVREIVVVSQRLAIRVESQTPDGEALRDDDDFAYVSAWEFAGENHRPILHKEPLVYDYVEMKQRSYK